MLRHYLAGLPMGGVMVLLTSGNIWVMFWAVWIMAFLAVELTAVFNARLGDTFSEMWWRYLRIKTGEQKTADGRVVQYQKPYPLWVAVPLRLLIIGFGVWLIGHLGFGLWGGE